MNKVRASFTLIELMIILSIIGIFGILAVQAYEDTTNSCYQTRIHSYSQKIIKISQNNECAAYRFYDSGRNHYFVKCVDGSTIGVTK